MILEYSLVFVWSVRRIYLVNFDTVGRDRLMLEALFDWLEKRLMLICCERKTLLFRWNGTSGKFKRTRLEFQFARNGKPRDDIENAGNDNDQVSESTYMCPKRIYMLPFIPSDHPLFSYYDQDMDHLKATYWKSSSRVNWCCRTSPMLADMAYTVLYGVLSYISHSSFPFRPRLVRDFFWKMLL
jgi:hypothetical protein